MAHVEDLRDLAKFGLPAKDVHPSVHLGVLELEVNAGPISQLQEDAAKIALLTQAMVEFTFNGKPHAINQYTAAEMLTEEVVREKIHLLEKEIQSRKEQLAFELTFLKTIYPSNDGGNSK